MGVDDEVITLGIPMIEKLPENNVRTGVISDEAYYAIMRRLLEHQQMLWCFGYRLGVRKGELLKILVEWVLPHWKQEEPFIKIPGFDEKGNRITKSGKPHTIPLYHPELRPFVEMASTGAISIVLGYSSTTANESRISGPDSSRLAPLLVIRN